MLRITVRIECSIEKRPNPRQSLRTRIPQLCGQTATESPHRRQEYGFQGALTKVGAGFVDPAAEWSCPRPHKRRRRGVAPRDEGGNAKVPAGLAVWQRSA